MRGEPPDIADIGKTVTIGLVIKINSLKVEFNLSFVAILKGIATRGCYLVCIHVSVTKPERGRAV